MDEVELIDEALIGCYNLQHRIATLLMDLSDIKEEDDHNAKASDYHPKNTKASKNRRTKDKNKSVTNTKSTKKIENNNNDTIKHTIKDEQKQTPSSNDKADTELAYMFSKLNNSYNEENSDAYLKRYKQHGEHIFRHKKNPRSRVKNNIDTESTEMLAKINDMIVKVNTEKNFKAKKVQTSRNKKSKDQRSKVNDSKRIEKPRIKPIKNIDSDEEFYLENSLKIKELKSQSSSNASDTDSVDSGISSGLRSLQEINLTYAKIDKRFIEVKRSVESVVVEMKHVDEIINRQKGVFHINFACASNESFICRH